MIFDEIWILILSSLSWGIRLGIRWGLAKASYEFVEVSKASLSHFHYENEWFTLAWFFNHFTNIERLPPTFVNEREATPFWRRLFTTSREMCVRCVMWNSCFINSRKLFRSAIARRMEKSCHCWRQEFNKISWIFQSLFYVPWFGVFSLVRRFMRLLCNAGGLFTSPGFLNAFENVAPESFCGFSPKRKSLQFMILQRLPFLLN